MVSADRAPTTNEHDFLSTHHMVVPCWCGVKLERCSQGLQLEGGAEAHVHTWEVMGKSVKR